ncbi:MAG: radical SAM protein [archaeon]
MIKETMGNSFASGKLARGCELCIRGSKLVLFLTGICQSECWYCPISEKRKGKDITWANEREVRSDEDIFEEAKRQSAEGASITGGEPFLRFDRLLESVRLFKDNFGHKFHLHLYTYGGLASPERLRKLDRAELDEIRFHKAENLPDRKEYSMSVGVEVPLIPGTDKELLAAVDRIAGRADFLNLNELEYSDSNSDAMMARGFEQKNDLSYGIKGSIELGMKILEYADGKVPAHLCPSELKDHIQFRNRLKRTAKNVRRKYEKETSEGLLLKGVIEGDAAAHRRLLKKFSLSPEYFVFDSEKGQIEASETIARRLAGKIAEKAFIVEEYPTFGRLEAERAPLN